MKRTLRPLGWILSLIVIVATLGQPAEASFVRFSTVLGDIDVRLYDSATPQTVANFLNYVADGDYDDSFIHRSVTSFVIQGGGFYYDDSVGVTDVPTDAPVQNEPGISNTRGTIAMAKQGGNPNSATSQWFFNLADNSANLDAQNGGFTVFGRVLSGMDVVDQIAAIATVNAGGAFTDLPVRNWTTGQPIMDSNLVNLSTIATLDYMPGDYNFDGQVDQTDLAVVNNSFGTTEAAADGNGDGVVNESDRQIVLTALGGLPEPSTALLAAFGTLLVAAKRSRG